MMIIILFVSLLIIATQSTSPPLNSNTTCTPAQLSGDSMNIVYKHQEQCISQTCLSQQLFFTEDIDQTALLSLNPQFENVEVTLNSLAAFCPSDNTNCFSEDCIELSATFRDYTTITPKNSGNLLENFTFDLPMRHLSSWSKCNQNITSQEYTCSLNVTYQVKGMDGDINAQNIVFKIAAQTNEYVQGVVEAMPVNVRPFFSTCENDFIDLKENNIGSSVEYLQNEALQYYYKFFIEYKSPYYHNPDCVDQVVTFNNKVIESGEEEFDQWVYDQSSMKSAFNINKDNIEAYGCKKTTNIDGTISYDCSLKVEFFLKDSTNTLWYTYITNQQMTVSGDQTALNSVGIETVTLKSLQQDLVICDNLACDNELSPPFSYFLNETIYVKQSMNDPSYVAKYLDIQSVKIGGKDVEIIEKDASQAGNVRYGFQALEASSEEQELEVISKVRDTAPSTRLLSVVPTTSHSFAIRSNIQIKELKEVPAPVVPPTPISNPIPPQQPQQFNEDDGSDNTALVIILILVSVLLVVVLLFGLLKYLQFKGKLGGSNEVQVIPSDRQQIETDSNENVVEIEGEKIEKQGEQAKKRRKRTKSIKTEIDIEESAQIN